MWISERKAACKGTQQLPTLLGQKCLELLRPCWKWYANGCTSPKHPIARNRVCKRTQHVTSNNVGYVGRFTGPKGCRLTKLAFINLIYVCFLLQASKGSLHRAAVSEQQETVNKTEYVDLSDDLFDQSDLPGPSFLKDEVLVVFSLCKSYVIPGLSRSLYLRILFDHSG